MTKGHGGLQSVAIGFDRKRAKAVGKRRPLSVDRRTRSRVSASEATFVGMPATPARSSTRTVAGTPGHQPRGRHRQEAAAFKQGIGLPELGATHVVSRSV
jgi:hypothetical protein